VLTVGKKSCLNLSEAIPGMEWETAFPVWVHEFAGV